MSSQFIQSFGAQVRILVDEVMGLVRNPDAAWEAIKHKPATVDSLFARNVMWFAAIPALVNFLQMAVLGFSVPELPTTYRAPVLSSLLSAVANYGAWLILVYAMGYVVFFLAPRFQASTDRVTAIKFAAHSLSVCMTGIAFSIIPFVGPLVCLAAGAYSIFLLFRGAPIMTGVGEMERPVFVLAVVFISAVIGAVLFRTVYSTFGFWSL